MSELPPEIQALLDKENERRLFDSMRKQRDVEMQEADLRRPRTPVNRAARRRDEAMQRAERKRVRDGH